MLTKGNIFIKHRNRSFACSGWHTKSEARTKAAGQIICIRSCLHSTCVTCGHDDPEGDSYSNLWMYQHRRLYRQCNVTSVNYELNASQINLISGTLSYTTVVVNIYVEHQIAKRFPLSICKYTMWLTFICCCFEAWHAQCQKDNVFQF